MVKVQSNLLSEWTSQNSPFDEWIERCRDIHAGSWYARYQQAGGDISKEDADRMVAEARLKRRQRKPK